MVSHLPLVTAEGLHKGTQEASNKASHSNDIHHNILTDMGHLRAKTRYKSPAHMVSHLVSSSNNNSAKVDL